MVSRRRPIAPTLALAFLATLVGGGCERLAGIHSSTRVTRDASGGDADATAAPDGTGDGTAADRADSGEVGIPGDAAGGGDGNDAAPADAPRVEGGAPVDGGNADSSAAGDAGAPDAGATKCGADPSVPVPLSGTAFRFGSGPNGGSQTAKGLCGFVNSQLPKGMYYGAVETSLYAGAARCGTCMRLQSGTVTVEVQVIDALQPLAAAHGFTISVDSEAQSLLSPAGGNPEVRFSFVPCTVTGNIEISFLGPLNPSVILMNHRNQLQAVQLVTSTTSVDLVRQTYNTWTPPAGFTFGGGTVSLILTDTFGNAVRVSDVAVTTARVDSGKQFPLCPK